jgi:hypothetical protein
MGVGDADECLPRKEQPLLVDSLRQVQLDVGPVAGEHRPPDARTVHVEMEVLGQLSRIFGIEEAQGGVVGLHLAQVVLLVDRLQPELDALALDEHPVTEHLLVRFDLVLTRIRRFQVGRQLGVQREQLVAVVLARGGYAHVGLAGVLDQLRVHALLEAFQRPEGLHLRRRGRRVPL